MQNGKGYYKRPTNLKVFNENFDDINWRRKEKKPEEKPKAIKPIKVDNQSL
jgi:hypothetical protein